MTTRGRPHASLTHRQRQILHLVSLGLSDVEIAARMAVSPETVATHLSNAYGRLGARNRAHAVRLCYERRILLVADQR